MENQEIEGLARNSHGITIEKINSEQFKLSWVDVENENTEYNYITKVGEYNAKFIMLLTPEKLIELTEK